MKKVTIVGTGYVGLVTGACLANAGHRVICCDTNTSVINMLQHGICTFYEPNLEEIVRINHARGGLSFTSDIGLAVVESDIIFICVGTPGLEDGKVDLSYVESVARSIGDHLNGYKIVVNKSTVPIGTAELVERIIRKHLIDRSVPFDVVSNPEFLREGSAVSDFLEMERVVIGSSNLKASETISELYRPFKPKLHITDVKSAELIKYAANAFLATKISFVNAIANLCDLVGADVEEVATGIGMDSRIGSKFLKAGIGFGGSCFRKDINGLLNTAQAYKYDFSLLESVLSINDGQRQLVIDKLISVLPDIKGKTIGILGLAFKPNTDDMRDAPSLDVIRKLVELGAKVKAFDPVAIPKARAWIHEEIQYLEDLYETVEQCDACIILTEWENIVRMDLREVSKLMNTPVIIDGRNCIPRSEIPNSGIIYLSIGRNNDKEMGRSLLTNRI